MEINEIDGQFELDFETVEISQNTYAIDTGNPQCNCSADNTNCPNAPTVQCGRTSPQNTCGNCSG